MRANVGNDPMSNMTSVFQRFLTEQKGLPMPAVAEKNGHTTTAELLGTEEVAVVRGGNSIVLPDGMSIEKARACLRAKEEEENQIVAISEKIPAFTLDGAVAFMEVLKKRYGWTNLHTVETMFGSKPPRMLGVEISATENMQVPWGECSVPNIDGVMTPSVWADERGVPMFLLTAKVKRKHEKEVASIAAEVRKYVSENSIYRGKIVSMNFRDSDGDRMHSFPIEFSPKYLRIDTNELANLVYSEDTEKIINVNLMTPVRLSKRCRLNKIPLKRGILIEGSYGTGKTLTAYKLALECEKYGWTFLYLKDVRDLDLALSFARMYQPCVVFSEDVDRCMAGPRTPEMDQILNIFDGVDTKNTEVMVLLTTNYRKFINPAFIRPGRIDTLVEIKAPDDAAVVRLVRNYSQSGEEAAILDADDKAIVEALSRIKGANAAFIREAVERAKLSAVSHSQSDDEPIRITKEDLKAAALTMEGHVKLLQPELSEQANWESIDPLKLAADIIMDQVTGNFLNKLANPKTVEKLIVKANAKRGFGGSFNSN